MADEAHEYSDQKLAEIEERVANAYRQAYNELIAKMNDFETWYEKERSRLSKQVAAGELSESDFQSWLEDQAVTSRYWRANVSSMAQDLTNAAQISASIINDELPDIYAENVNYGTYTVEQLANVNTAFNLYDRPTVLTLLASLPSLYPKADINVAKDVRWNTQHITAAITQGVLQGEPIGAIAERLKDVAIMSSATAVRMARTCTTSAENLGRINSYQRAIGMGIEVQKEWVATLDRRTRTSHRALDGEVKPIEEAFSNGLMYPGDPDGVGGEVYNCRCTLVPSLPNLHDNENANRASKLGGMSYEEWKADKSAEAVQLGDERKYVQGRNLLQDRDFLRSVIEDPEGSIERAVTAQGYDGLPTIVSEAQLGENVMYRGVRADDAETLARYHDDLLNGDWYYSARYGGAAFGRGMYAAGDASVAEEYGQGVNGTVERMQLKSGARVFEIPSVADVYNMKAMNALLDDSGFRDVFEEAAKSVGGDAANIPFDGEITTAAAIAGYDAVHIDGRDFYIILNRTALEIVG